MILQFCDPLGNPGTDGAEFSIPIFCDLYKTIMADAICDRNVYYAYVIRIEGDTMIKRKGIME